MTDSDKHSSLQRYGINHGLNMSTIKGSDILKHFTAIIYTCSKQAKVCVYDKPLLLSLMFVGKAKSRTLKGSSFQVLHSGRSQPYS
jgi:hypothetical protein